MAFEDDGGAKKEKVLSHLSRRKEGSGFPRHGCGVMRAPSVVQQVTGSADVWGGGECLKNLVVLAGAPAMPGQCKLRTTGLHQGSPSLGSWPGWPEPKVSTRA